MRTFILITTFLLLLCACKGKEYRMILGKWEVEEYWVSGRQYPSDRYIEFRGDGTYISVGEEQSEVKGEYRIRNDKLILSQPEITDMHGKRVVEPFSRTWYMSLSPEWLIMEGTAESNTQDMKLILHKEIGSENADN